MNKNQGCEEKIIKIEHRCNKNQGFLEKKSFKIKCRCLKIKFFRKKNSFIEQRYNKN